MQEYIKTAKKTITSTTKKIVKKSSEVYEVTKLSFKISSLKDTISEEYIKLGKMAYDGYKGMDTSNCENADDIFSNIDSLYAQIDDISAEISALKKLKTCDVCGAEISSESTFCANCGKEI